MKRKALAATLTPVIMMTCITTEANPDLEASSAPASGTSFLDRSLDSSSLTRLLGVSVIRLRVATKPRTRGPCNLQSMLPTPLTGPFDFLKQFRGGLQEDLSFFRWSVQDFSLLRFFARFPPLSLPLKRLPPPAFSVLLFTLPQPPPAHLRSHRPQPVFPSLLGSFSFPSLCNACTPLLLSPPFPPAACCDMTAPET